MPLPSSPTACNASFARASLSSLVLLTMKFPLHTGPAELDNSRSGAALRLRQSFSALFSDCHLFIWHGLGSPPMESSTHGVWGVGAIADGGRGLHELDACIVRSINKHILHMYAHIADVKGHLSQI